MDSPARLWQRWRADPLRSDATDAVAIAAVGLASIALGIVDLGGLPLPGWVGGPWWHAVPLLLGCVALLGKRYRPVTVVVIVIALLAVDLAIGGSIGMYVVLIDALYHLILYCPRPWIRPAIGIIAIPIVLGPTAVYVVSGDVRLAFFALIQAFATLGTPAWWALSVRQQSELAELASARAEDLQRLSDLRRDKAVQDERSRMARDLHDALSSHLSTIAIHSGAALAEHGPATLANGSPTVLSDDGPSGSAADGQQTALREIRRASVRALEDLRQMILLLRTGHDEITPAAHLRDIEPLVVSARATGLQVTVEGDPAALPHLPSVVDHAAYRIVQESLANATKHAPGSTVVLSLDACERLLRLEVHCHPTTVAGRTPGSGLGLTTMRSRATALGGTFHAGWHGDGPRRSWVVQAELPLNEVVTQ